MVYTDVVGLAQAECYNPYYYRGGIQIGWLEPRGDSMSSYFGECGDMPLDYFAMDPAVVREQVAYGMAETYYAQNLFCFTSEQEMSNTLTADLLVLD